MTYRIPLLLSLSALLFACGGDDDTTDTSDVGAEDTDESVDVEPDGVDDVSTDDVITDDVIDEVEEDTSEPLTEIRVSLSNINEVNSVWVQTEGGRPWFTIQDADGNQLYIDASCGNCACGVEDCPACPDVEPAFEELVPGDKIRGTWDGVFYEVVFDERSGRPCLEEHFEPLGTYGARYSFSYVEPNADGTLPEATLSNTVVSFEFGVDNEVAYAAP